MTKQTIIDSAVDLFGYSESDFDGMSKADIVSYLDDNMPEITAYNN